MHLVALKACPGARPLPSKARRAAVLRAAQLPTRGGVRSQPSLRSHPAVRDTGKNMLGPVEGGLCSSASPGAAAAASACGRRRWRLGAALGAGPTDKAPSEGPDPTWRICLFYFMYFGIVGIYTPFFPGWLRAVHGLTGDQIGSVLSTALVSKLVIVPAMGVLADVTARPRVVALAACAASCAMYTAMSALVPVGAVAGLALAATLAKGSMAAVLPLAESISLRVLKSNGRSDRYGSVRLWGSVGFIVSNLAGGRLISTLGSRCVVPAVAVCMVALFVRPPAAPSTLGSRCVVPAVAVCMVALFAAVSALPSPGEAAAPGPPQDEEGPGPGKPSVWQQLGPLLRSPVFVTFLLSASILQAGHAVYYSFGTIDFTAAGVGGDAIGMLWAFGVVAEVLLFAAGGAFLKRAGAPLVLMGAGVAAAVRWGIMATRPSLPLLLATQTLHAITFGATHLGAMSFIGAAVPGGLAASAQSIYSCLTDGVVMGLATKAAGRLYSAYGPGAFLFSAVLGLVGCALAAVLWRTWDGGQLRLQAAGGDCDSAKAL